MSGPRRGPGIIETVAKEVPAAALVSALAPAVALVAGLPFVNRIEPVVLGLPFLLFWILGWVLVTPVFLAIAYLLAEATPDRTAGGASR
jgi:hypothetical protein